MRYKLQLLIVITLTLCAGCNAPSDQKDSSLAQESVTFTLVVSEEKLSKTPQTIEVKQDQHVVMMWTSDEAIHLHLQGYEIKFDLLPSTPSTIDFIADTTGQFPITTHDVLNNESEHQPLLYLEVSPR